MRLNEKNLQNCNSVLSLPSLQINYIIFILSFEIFNSHGFLKLLPFVVWYWSAQNCIV